MHSCVRSALNGGHETIEHSVVCEWSPETSLADVLRLIILQLRHDELRKCILKFNQPFLRLAMSRETGTAVNVRPFAVRALDRPIDVRYS